MEKLLSALAICVMTQMFTGCGGSTVVPTPVSPSPVAAPQPPPAQPAIPRGPAGYTLTAVSLSGTVYDATKTAERVPIPGARVYCELCGTETHQFAVADANGFYVFPADLSSGGGVWLSGRYTPVFVESRGYTDPPGVPFFQGVCPPNYSCREVFIAGDTRLDIDLVRLVQ